MEETMLVNQLISHMRKSDYPKIAELLEELLRLRAWKNDIVKELLRYDADNLEDLVKISRANAIDQFRDELLELCGCSNVHCYSRECKRCLENVVESGSIIDLAAHLKKSWR